MQYCCSLHLFLKYVPVLLGWHGMNLTPTAVPAHTCDSWQCHNTSSTALYNMSKNCSVLLEISPLPSQRAAKLQVITVACWLLDLLAAVGPGVLSTKEILLISYDAWELFWCSPPSNTTNSQIQSMSKAWLQVERALLNNSHLSNAVNSY